MAPSSACPSMRRSASARPAAVRTLSIAWVALLLTVPREPLPLAGLSLARRLSPLLLAALLSRPLGPSRPQGECRLVWSGRATSKCRKCILRWLCVSPAGDATAGSSHSSSGFVVVAV